MTKSHIAPQWDSSPSYESPIALELIFISMNALASKEQNRLRVLVTDDTALYRRAISEILSTLEDVEVVGSAFDGEDCLGMAEKLKPDLITLDIQMPRRDGLSTLQELRKRGIDSEVVMVCSETLESANQTLSALRMGALDLILKPSGSDSLANKRNLETQLSKQLQTIRFKKSRRPMRSSGIDMSSAASASQSMQSIRSATATPKPSLIQERAFVGSNNPKCVCIGISTGGPQSLTTLVKGLPVDLGVPIFIVQHMPPVFTKSLAEHLNNATKLNVSEATDGEFAKANHIYIAPGGKHMKVERNLTNIQIRVTDDPPVGACKPSVDYLFESIGSCYGRDTLAIIMTGMGSDGLAGCKKLHAVGARILAQDEASCVVYGMPRQIAENGLAHEILALDMVAARITQLIKK